MKETSNKNKEPIVSVIPIYSESDSTTPPWELAKFLGWDVILENYILELRHGTFSFYEKQ